MSDFDELEILSWKTLVRAKVLSSNILDISVMVLSFAFIALAAIMAIILERYNDLIFYSLLAFATSIFSVLISYRLSIAWHESELIRLCRKEEKEHSPIFDGAMNFLNHFSLFAFALGVLTFCLGVDVLFFNGVKQIGMVALCLVGGAHG